MGVAFQKPTCTRLLLIGANNQRSSIWSIEIVILLTQRLDKFAPHKSMVLPFFRIDDLGTFVVIVTVNDLVTVPHSLLILTFTSCTS